MGYVIAYCVVVIVALSPLIRRFYIGHVWTHAHGTVIRLDGGISQQPGAGGAWVWAPIIEYQAAGQRFSSKISYWQSLNAKPKYRAGDRVKILYDPRKPSRVMLDSWFEHIVYTAILGILISGALLQGR